MLITLTTAALTLTHSLILTNDTNKSHKTQTVMTAPPDDYSAEK